MVMILRGGRRSVAMRPSMWMMTASSAFMVQVPIRFSARMMCIRISICLSNSDGMSQAIRVSSSDPVRDRMMESLRGINANSIRQNEAGPVACITRAPEAGLFHWRTCLSRRPLVDWMAGTGSEYGLKGRGSAHGSMACPVSICSTAMANVRGLSHCRFIPVVKVGCDGETSS